MNERPNVSSTYKRLAAVESTLFGFSKLSKVDHWWHWLVRVESGGFNGRQRAYLQEWSWMWLYLQTWCCAWLDLVSGCGCEQSHSVQEGQQTLTPAEWLTADWSNPTRGETKLSHRRWGGPVIVLCSPGAQTDGSLSSSLFHWKHTYTRQLHVRRRTWS